jgi:hypothetical protein
MAITMYYLVIKEKYEFLRQQVDEFNSVLTILIYF